MTEKMKRSPDERHTKDYIRHFDSHGGLCRSEKGGPYFPCGSFMFLNSLNIAALNFLIFNLIYPLLVDKDLCECLKFQFIFRRIFCMSLSSGFF